MLVREGIVGKINTLREGGLISTLTADVSHQIRQDASSLAHGDIGEESISQDDATAILEFMDVLPDEVFQRPAKLQRLKERREERRQDPGAAGWPGALHGSGPSCSLRMTPPASLLLAPLVPHRRRGGPGPSPVGVVGLRWFLFSPLEHVPGGLLRTFG